MKRTGQVLLILLAVIATGCMTDRIPSFEMSSGGPEQFRRYTGRPAVDYVFRWNKVAFKPAETFHDKDLSPAMIEVLERHGQPDYYREDVKARRNEHFTEWVYWDRNVICQFVKGELVYEGDLLDSDRWLVEKGYPAEAYFQAYEEGPVRETWIYEGLFATRSIMVSFSDGEEVFRGLN